MQWRTWISVLLALTTFGCGAERKMLGPESSRDELRAESGASPAGAAGKSGTVYTMTNAPSGNAVLAFARSANGALGAPQSYATGGAGTGAGLGNQGALALGDGHRWLYVVNARSNDVSVFRVGAKGLDLVDRVASGGERPVSVTTHHDLVYVLNAGGAGNIQGFRVSPAGDLTAIAGSNRPLSGPAAAAAQIGFTPDGNTLIVSERATNTLSVYDVLADGSSTGPRSQASSGQTPFGFGFGHHGTLVVSEAFGGGANASAVSSYRVGHDGNVSLVSGSVPTLQTAACWIAVQGNGRFAYTANAGSASVVGYAVGPNGSLSRLDGVTPTTTGPTDMAFSVNSRYLYVLRPGAGAISVYSVDASGELTAVGVPAAAPPGVNGLVAL